RLRFFEHHGSSPHDGELGLACGGLDARALLLGKHASEQTTGRQVRRRYGAVVADVAAQLEPAGHILRMVPLDARAGREVRWAAKHEVEAFVGPQGRCRSEVRVADLVAR